MEAAGQIRYFVTKLQYLNVLVGHHHPSGVQTMHIGHVI
jgi:hypothetical protein